MPEERKPTLPSEMAKEKLPYYLTASVTTRPLAPQVVEREGVKPITYNWEELSDEVKELVRRVWKLEPLTEEELDRLPYEEYARYLFDPRRGFSKPEALDGVRVLEVCRPDWSNFALQFCGSLLTEFGAEIIKIEDPYWGDAMRWAGPPVEQGGAMKAEGENWPPHGTSLCGFCENRNRYCVTIDITTEKGRKMFKDLARIADIVIENYDPGYMDLLGIGYRQLREINPRLVYCAVTPYGQWGEESWRKPFETGVQAMSTLSSFTGPINYQAETVEEAQKGSIPTRIGWHIGDVSGGLTSAFGILAALLHRERKSGRGQMIDVSNEGLIMRSCDCSFDWYSLTGRIRPPWGNWDLEICPYGLHPCKGGRWSIVAGMGRLWWAICDAVGKVIGPEESEILKNAFPDNPVRIQWTPQQQINSAIDKWTAQHEMDELMELALKGGFAAGGVYNVKEICEHDHFLDRGGIREVDDPIYGKFFFQGPKPALSETPGRIKWASRPMGWDNEFILRKYLGLSRSDLKEIEAEGIVSPRGGWGERDRPSRRREVKAKVEASSEVSALVEKARSGAELTLEEENLLPYDEWCRYAFDPRKAAQKPKALDGIRVIDWTTMIFAPMSCAILGELGAEVIKLELPGRGDTMRYSGPPEEGYLRWAEEKSGTKAEGILGEGVKEEVLPEVGTGLGCLDVCMMNKFAVSLDIHPGPGQEIFKNLISKADAFVENVRTGTTARWGVSYRELKKINPRLVYLAENGPGQWGREDLVRGSYDILGQSAGGSVYVTGFPDSEQLKVPIWVCDYFAGTMGSFGVLVSLYWREKSGKGQFVEQSQIEAMTRWLGPGIVWHSKTGIIQERYGNRNRWVCPDGIVRVKDGFIAIGADDEAFKALCECIGGRALRLAKKYPTNVDRVPEEAQDEIYQVIEEWAKNLTVAQIEDFGKRYGFGTAPIKNAKDACEQKHYLERGEVQEVDDPWYGKMKIQGPVPLYSNTPGHTEFICKPMGWDTEYILRRFCGLSTEQILELERQHQIGRVAGAEGSRDLWGWQ